MRRLLPEPADEVDLYTEYAVPDTSLTATGWHLRMNFVSSADGAVTESGRSEGLSTPADKAVFAVLRDLADVILVGAGTARVEGYGPARPSERRRARRRELGLAEAPAIAVVSGGLRFDADSELFAAPDATTFVFTHEAAPADHMAALARTRAEVLTRGADGLDLAGCLRELAGRGLSRVLCEGGPHLFASLLAADLVDETCLTLSPLLTGPGAGRIVAGAALPVPHRLRLAGLLEDDGALFLRYTTDRAAGRATDRAADRAADRATDRATDRAADRNVPGGQVPPGNGEA